MIGANRSAIESRLEERFGVARAVSVGRAALGLAVVLRCWIRQSRAVLVALPAAVCHDVLVAVREAGCTPVFCDVDPATGLVPKREWVRVRSLGATVAIVVHLYGNPADVGEVQSIFTGPHCLVIDDAAQALGTNTSGGLAGAQGDVGLLSFGATKQISAGGAALLFRDLGFADEVEATLAVEATAPVATRSALQAEFRRRLEGARAKLRIHGSAAAHSFFGLLQGYGPTLQVGLQESSEPMLLRELNRYAALTARRLAKRDVWLSSMNKSELQPIGMGSHTVPWRFVCRLPGISWDVQHRIGEAMRNCGMNVSHWYLPVHWMQSIEPEQLIGVEALSQEVFQFWIDDETPISEVYRQTEIVAEVVSTHE